VTRTASKSGYRVLRVDRPAVDGPAVERSGDPAGRPA
jgi:hypothetical protein